MPSFRILTFGCKVNQCDSQVLRETLSSWGLSEADPDAAADVVIINTCTVTAGADAKCAKAIRKAKRGNPETLAVVTGCLAGRTNFQPPAGADLLVPFRDLLPLARFLRERNILNSGLDTRTEFHAVEQSYFAEHTRAFLKIQDGCDCFCSYCIVPFVRPKLWSEAPEKVIAAINDLSAREYKEIVLTGVHLGFYGRGCPVGGDSSLSKSPRSPLVALLGQIERNCSIERIRLSSLEVNEVTDELIDLMASSGKICHHLHIPLQSGDTDILKRMNRRYSADFFIRKVSNVRKKIPDIGITTDIIVGFPGETEEQFQQTCRLVEELEFAKIHVFRYSRRPGTQASDSDSPVPQNVTSRRARRLIHTGEDAAAKFKHRFIGKTLDVLVETHDKKRNRSQGLTSNYIRMHITGADEKDHNKFVPVQIQEIEENGIAAGVTV